MVRLVGERDTDSKAAQALAELYLSLDHAIRRLELACQRDDIQEAAQTLLHLHTTQMTKLNEMLDLQGAMADTQKSWSQWLNETIATAADPAAGMDANPVEAVTTSEASFLDALNKCMGHILTDPLRSALEHIKQDTLDALQKTPFRRDN